MATRDDEIRQGTDAMFAARGAPTVSTKPAAAAVHVAPPGTDAPTPTGPATTSPAASRRVQITAYLEPGEAAALEAMAKREDRSVAYIVRQAIRRHLGLR